MIFNGITNKIQHGNRSVVIVLLIFMIKTFVNIRENKRKEKYYLLVIGDNKVIMLNTKLNTFCNRPKVIVFLYNLDALSELTI